MEQYLLPILFFLALGALTGILLTVASKLLYVKTDETVEKITEALPGANCGGCGFSGCEGYAKAVADGTAPTNLCKPGGYEVTLAVSSIMGVSAEPAEREYAYVHCNGSCDICGDKFDYVGTKSCVAAEKFYSGKKSCSFGCLGFGDCISVCNENAVHIVNGVAVINPRLCKGCGKCVKACPNHLISLIKESQRVAVHCNSGDIGKATKAVCKNGCLACGICVKKCPNEAVVINNNHAEIIGDKCTGCGICAGACPVKCIQILPECQ